SLNSGEYLLALLIGLSSQEIDPPTNTGRFNRLSGAELANAVHGYDRVLGYPFAWYFMMLGSTASNYTLADAVLQDQMGAYDYLPKRDLKVLREWEAKPYGV
ncbi:MAG: hypothetical protein AB2825_18395, partial [Candidatus Thiodiazotropha endolucinida]